MTNPTINITPNSIPADWAKLGAETGYHPKEAHELRLWVAGMTGEGKSTFTRSIPDSLTLDFGDETGGVFEPRGPRICVPNYERYMEVTDKLIQDGKAGKRWVKRIIIDNADDWVNMIINVLQIEKNCEDITDYGSSGRGWAMIRNRCWGRIQALAEAGYVWSVNANIIEKTKQVGTTSMTVIRPVVFPGFASMFGRRADYKLVVYARTKTIAKTTKVKLPDGRTIDKPVGEETKKVYYCQCRSNDLREAKSRGVPGMKETFEIPLIDGWNTFAEYYNEARDKALALSKTLNQGAHNG